MGPLLFLATHVEDGRATDGEARDVQPPASRSRRPRHRTPSCTHNPTPARRTRWESRCRRIRRRTACVEFHVRAATERSNRAPELEDSQHRRAACWRRAKPWLLRETPQQTRCSPGSRRRIDAPAQTVSFDRTARSCGQRGLDDWRHPSPRARAVATAARSRYGQARSGGIPPHSGCSCRLAPPRICATASSIVITA